MNECVVTVSDFKAVLETTSGIIIPLKKVYRKCLFSKVFLVDAINVLCKICLGD